MAPATLSPSLPSPSVHRFDTPIGRCAIAWQGERLSAVWLPARDDAALVRHIASRLPDAQEAAPSTAMRALVERLVALMHGARDDLADIVLDWGATPAFERRVYEATRAIGPGEHTTYGALAKTLGEPGAARAVGRALGRNPWPIVVPCHRVVGAGRTFGGFSAPGGTDTKRRLLALEGAKLDAVAPGLF